MILAISPLLSLLITHLRFATKMILGYSDEAARIQHVLYYIWRIGGWKLHRGATVPTGTAFGGDGPASWRCCGMLEIRALDLSGDTRRTLLPLDC